MNQLTYHIFLPIILFIFLQYTNSFIFPFIRSHIAVKSPSPSSSWLLSSASSSSLSTPTFASKSEFTIIRKTQSYLLPTTSFTSSVTTTTSIEASVIAPPKTDTKKKNDVKIDPIVKDNKASNVQKLYEEFIQENNEEYMVILYDDPFNKRAYVASVLMDVFSWSEDMANSVMLRAHTTGFAVTGEWNKELAEEYWKKLIQKGLLAEVVKSKDMSGGGGGGDAGGGSSSSSG